MLQRKAERHCGIKMAAGNMPNGTTTAGDMDNGVTSTPTGAQATESVTVEVALSVMQGVLSVF